jgi:hypothetical protein
MDGGRIVHTNIPVGLASNMSHNVVKGGQGDGGTKASEGEKIIN